MDPEQTWEEAIEGLVQFVVKVEHLFEWEAKGGFVPESYGELRKNKVVNMFLKARKLLNKLGR